MVLIFAAVNGEHNPGDEAKYQGVESTEEALVINLFLVENKCTNTHHGQRVGEQCDESESIRSGNESLPVGNIHREECPVEESAVEESEKTEGQAGQNIDPTIRVHIAGLELLPCEDALIEFIEFGDGDDEGNPHSNRQKNTNQPYILDSIDQAVLQIVVNGDNVAEDAPRTKLTEANYRAQGGDILGLGVQTLGGDADNEEEQEEETEWEVNDVADKWLLARP